MEHIGINIVDVDITDANIIITYENESMEKIPKNEEHYKAMYKLWLIPQPMFISDIFKQQLHDLGLYGLNSNSTCFNSLNAFFSNSNKANVIKFFTYMRNRDLTLDKLKWTPVSK